MYAGIDVSATRGFDVAVLDEDRRLILLAKAKDLEAAGVVVRGLPLETVIGVDAPPAPSRGFAGTGKGYRVAEQELHRAGVSLYPVPAATEEAPSWMRAGFALYEVLAKAGFPPFFGGSSTRRGVAIEVYPHLTYRTLAGAGRAGASKIEWARAAIRRKVTGLPRDATQDQLDAAAAAYTAWMFGHERWVGYGDPREGVIIAPRVEAREEPAPGHDQLSLGIEGTPRPAKPAAAFPDDVQTPFAKRVLRYVARIPPGRVATYGDVARACGKPVGARAVGTLIARHMFEVPSHRIVDASGRASAAYPGGAERQLERLVSEGVAVSGNKVDLAAARWRGST